jgi:beta-glucanase (GH16 family)
MYLTLINLCLALLPFIGCSSSDPSKTTTDDGTVSLSMIVDEINSSSTITCNVSVSSSGSLTFVDKGVCYSSSNATPTVNDSIQTANTNNITDYTLALSNLKEITTYYARPFLRTKNDTYYGYVQKVKTLGSSADYYATDKSATPAQYDGYNEIWSDEFNTDGSPSSNWSFENGFVRNKELQWYQKDNASVTDGCLVIKGEKETVKNPNYVAGSSDWKTNRDYAQYTSSSMTTSGNFSFKYGRILVRAKIPTSAGSWPAIWTLGNWYEWPSCGEIDILESYPSGGVPAIHANTCWGSDTRWSGHWNSVVKPLSYFTAKDPNWTSKYHIWRMDWDENVIRIYIDDELVNETDQANTQNSSSGGDGAYQYPFRQAHYILLNLAIGGNAGTPDDSAFPLKYYIDYVRVYQKK